MFALYAPDRTYLQRVKSSIPSDAVRIATGWWPDFARAAGAADCSIIAVGRLAPGAVVSRLRMLKRRLPAHPVVLVTSSDPDNARLLVALPVEQVVWTSEIEQTLPLAVERALTGGLLQRLAGALEAAGQLPVRVRRALALACRSNPPIRTVSALATAIGCDRRTLWLDWRSTFAVPPFRLEDFLDWILLFHAVGRKVRGRSWAAVAAESNVHRQTLASLAARLMGRRLSELAAGGRADVGRRFEREVVRPLLGNRGLDVPRPS
ncbi:MAG TPA: hypothetical protein VF188_18890 [Longimicrobiales bacterium]